MKMLNKKESNTLVVVSLWDGHYTE